MPSLDELLYGPNGTKVKKEEVFGTPLKDLVGKKKVKAKWVNGKLIDESGNVIQEAIPMKNALMGINDFMPVTGDIQAGVMAANDLKQGNYGNAALNSIGLLPFVPALGGVVKQTPEIKNIIKTLEKTNKSTIPKIPSKNVFKNDVSNLDFNILNMADDGFASGASVSKKISIDDIIPTQRNITTYNLEGVDKVTDEPMLVFSNGKYYVKDGHHRIARDILKGKQSINANVYNPLYNGLK
jgi:hypothetical protein